MTAEEETKLTEPVNQLATMCIGLIQTVTDQQKQIVALETKAATMPRYLGVWDETQTYDAGSVVTHAGSMWIARGTTAAKPGEGEGSFWTLCVKRGGPGKSAFDSWKASGGKGSEADFIRSLRGGVRQQPSGSDREGGMNLNRFDDIATAIVWCVGIRALT